MKALMQKGLLAATLLACGLAGGLCATAQDASPQEGMGRGGFAGMQRVGGTVTAVAGDAITVKTEDGTMYQVTTTANTRFMKGQNGQMSMIKLADLKAGDGVMASGNLDAPNKTLHAAMVFATDAAEVKKMRDNLGKTFIAGRVTAIDTDNLKMTIKRQDGVEQTIGFDETTSFKRGRGPRQAFIVGGPGGTPPATVRTPSGEGESITLADIKVGDQVSGTGSVKSGTFVPTQLMVMMPRGPREGRPGNGATPPAPPQQ